MTTNSLYPQMSKLFLVCLLIFPIFLFAQNDTTAMNNKKIDKLLNNICREVVGNLGQWEVDYMGKNIMIITDEKNNRMRIMTPIIEVKNLKKNEMEEAMKANFHKALDVKYAIYKEIVWSLFVHPLAELSESQFHDGVKQVYNASYSFGSTYQSTDIIFGNEN